MSFGLTKPLFMFDPLIILDPLQTVTAEATILWANRVFNDFCKKASTNSPVKVKDIGDVNQ